MHQNTTDKYSTLCPPPHHMYVQESGCVGRDGLPAEAVLYYVKGVSEGMKNYYWM